MSLIEPQDRVAPDWLALRRLADVTARAAAQPLVAHLLEQPPASAVDVGTGTGANVAYLSRFLGAADWILLDHDAELLDHAVAAADARHPAASVRPVVGDIAELDALVAEAASPVLVTCSALLDILSFAQLDALAITLARPGVVALLSLSVTGTFVLDPVHPLDEAVTAAFNAHQRRRDRPGPDAPRHLADACVRLGKSVATADTPWRLDGGSAPLIARLLAERVDAAAEARPALAGDFADWLDHRTTQLVAGSLRVEVGHVDLLVR